MTNVVISRKNSPPLLGVLGAWMTFKKAEMAKTLENELSMIETNPLNHNWSHFVILSGLTLHQFKKKTAVKRYLIPNHSPLFSLGTASTEEYSTVHILNYIKTLKL